METGETEQIHLQKRGWSCLLITSSVAQCFSPCESIMNTELNKVYFSLKNKKAERQASIPDRRDPNLNP